MNKKLCLFCNEIVPIKAEGEYDRFVGCHCSPDGYYSLLRGSYDLIQSLTYHRKRQIFPIVSAYIRELTDCDERVTLSIDDLDRIENSPTIPVTMEEKEGRLLQFLFRHSNGPGEPVAIHPLSHSFNLTYSPNLQELVYIIEKLRSEQSIIREVATLRLTDKGWSEAAARAGGKKLKSCIVLLPNGNEICEEWTESVFPKIEQCGYIPLLFHYSDRENRDKHTTQLISESQMVIADLTIPSPEVYFAAGYALGLNIPVIWTVKRSAADKLPVQYHPIRPIIWDTLEELAAMLQQKWVHS
ncbi:hypothetical protein [Paenibacillus sp. sgz302251]|uniref:hypothetical protein n=1 Tax=Paenibacillus sp. sgz302251 TaxID=3414493 RepID=UPI003C7C949A